MQHKNRHFNYDYSCGGYILVRVRKDTWGGAIARGRRIKLSNTTTDGYCNGLTGIQDTPDYYSCDYDGKIG